MLKALPARQGFELEYLKNFAENKGYEETGINDLQKATYLSVTYFVYKLVLQLGITLYIKINDKSYVF